MDPRPFRCAYDPELARASGGAQHGPKPVFVRARGGVTGDPRRRGPAVKGRRAVPQHLAPAGFAKRRPRDTRVHLSNLGPLVTRTQVSDAARFFGEVKSCEMVVARTTHASLGVASVVYGGAPALAARAAEQLVAACARGSLSIGGVRDVRAALDANKALLGQAQAEAEAEPPTLAEATLQRDLKSHQPLSPLPDDLNVKLVELRTLTTAQLDEWYRRFIGPTPTYVLIPHHNVSPLSTPVSEVADRFCDHRFARIAVNRTGFFVLFDSVDQAERCYAAMDGKRLGHMRLKLALTLAGERIPGAQLRVVRQRRHHIDAQAGPPQAAAPTPTATTTTTSRAQLSPEDLVEAGKAGVDALLSDMKRRAWDAFVRRTVIAAVNRAVEKRRAEANSAAADSSESSAAAPVTPESEPSEPEASYKSTFAKRGMMRDTGKASRNLPLPAVRMRKRNVDAGSFPPPKVLKRESVVPKTYIRDSRARALKRSHEDNESEEDDDDHDSADDSYEKYEDDDDNDNHENLHAGNTSEPGGDGFRHGENESRVAMKGVSDSEFEGPSSAPTRLVEKIALRGDELEDEKPFSLPPLTPPEDVPTLDFDQLKRLVRTPEDFTSLQLALQSAHLPPITEEEVRAQFCRKKTFKLDSVTSNWPEQPLPFREAPFRFRSDDERRSYLPVADSGMPNEIVQNYRHRPLYEGEEDEEDPSKLELRKDARVLSRSSFGAGSDLFADDTLSKNVKDVRLARSSIHDWGLYANELIPEGEFVIEYVGDVLRDEYADVRERNYMMEGIDSSYLFRLDNGTVIDATKRGNGARFINHSCDPNCIAQVFDHDGFKRVVLFSVREIQPNEELTFDYNFVRAQDDEGKVRCACGAANCRGWLM